ncbi:FG-GAP repeat domain-containing protein [Amycolatopsis nigrescens]|uniref:FG-GAP repeat domain-containing protein n=1 Tax=Amycolatopsis nigrescens TaxID=381445 RepID=UPI000399CB4E|nr:VCBS repeat-containing protein [Amycolatopsis nigrescens]
MNKRQKLWKLALPLSVVAAASVVTAAQAEESAEPEALSSAQPIAKPAQISFSAPVEYPAGVRAWAVTYADFNGDGKVDVATGNGGNSISVFAGKGDGTFGEKVDYTAPKLPYFLAFDIASADFTGDRKADIVLSGGNPAGNVLLYPNKGDGSFGEPKVVPFGFGPTQVATADLNRDGKQDLIASNNFAANVSVALGKGDGTFREERTFEVGPGPQGLTVGDINGDRVPDLITGNFGRVKDSVSVLLGKGDGSFREQRNYPAGMAVNDVVTGDFNRDGVTDIAAGQFIKNKVSVLLGKRRGGFSEPKEYSTGTALNEMTTADFNGDGVLDIVTTVSPDSGRDPGSPPPPNEKGAGVALLLGKGDGSFTEHSQFLMEGLMVSVQPVDLNGDKRVDLATANLTKNSMVVWLNEGAKS